MNTGGEAAEQIVRMSLEGFEVAAKITGAGAKNIAILLYSILKEEKKTKGKARLTSMLRSGKELKVFTVKSDDLKKFTQEAKKYGVLYCVLTDRKNKDHNAEVDVIARAEDASKISRIVERFNLASVDTASIVTEAEKSKDAKDGQPEPEIGVQEKAEKDNSFCVAYMVSSRYGVDTRGFDFSRLPREYAEMDTHSFNDLIVSNIKSFFKNQCPNNHIDRSIRSGCFFTVKNRKNIFINSRKNFVCKSICP